MLMMELFFCLFILHWVFIFSPKMMISMLLFLLIYMIYSSGQGFYFNWGEELGFQFSTYNYSLVILTLYILYLAVQTMKFDSLNGFTLFSLISLLLIIILKCFMSFDMVTFFFYFEASLIPTFFLVFKWGHNMNSIIASIYMLFYTIVFSLPLLVSMFLMYSMMSVEFEMVDEVELSSIQYILMVLGMFVKLPVFLIHVWLPKAHVEAPVFGSMILAALMLKLGGYGMLLMVDMFYSNDLVLDSLICFLLFGAAQVGLFCLMQVDLKMLVAYSSVVHMMMMCSGILTDMDVSIMGAQVTMIAHGLCSSGLFYMAYLFYLQTGSRLMLINKGLLSSNSKMNFMWFMLCSANFSIPLSLNLVGELLLFVGLMSYEFMLFIPLSFGCFFSVCYSIYMYIYIVHGSSNNKIMFDSVKNYMMIIMHLLPLFIMMFNLDLFF